MYNFIGIITVIILFLLCILSYLKIKSQHEELLKVYNELDTTNQLNERLRMELDYNELEINNKVIPILRKIQTTYQISKKDKIYLLDYLSYLIFTSKHYDVLSILYTMNLGKKFTFREATNIIIHYMTNRNISTDIQRTVEAIFYLITK